MNQNGKESQEWHFGRDGKCPDEDADKKNNKTDFPEHTFPPFRRHQMRLHKKLTNKFWLSVAKWTKRVYNKDR